MAKPKNTRRYSTAAAIALHSEANKSDPFAAKRIAMTIARDGYKEAQEIATESKRILDARDAATRKAYAEWLKTPVGQQNQQLAQVHTEKREGAARTLVAA